MHFAVVSLATNSCSNMHFYKHSSCSASCRCIALVSSFVLCRSHSSTSPITSRICRISSCYIPEFWAKLPICSHFRLHPGRFLWFVATLSTSQQYNFPVFPRVTTKIPSYDAEHRICRRFSVSRHDAIQVSQIFASNEALKCLCASLAFSKVIKHEK